MYDVCAHSRLQILSIIVLDLLEKKKEYNEQFAWAAQA